MNTWRGSKNMTDVQLSSRVEQVEAASLAAQLQKVPVFSGVSTEDLVCLGPVELIHAEACADLYDINQARRGFWILLEGELRLQKRQKDGELTLFGTHGAGETFGEVPLLAGKDSGIVVTVLKACSVGYLRGGVFLEAMFSFPPVRLGVLGNMARRLQVYQSQELHREKLISLGTMAAGLMHELNNPGAAARRAASQMRENLSNMQQISLRLCSQDVMTAGQAECLRLLQEQALQPRKASAMSSLDQADAEDQLASWFDAHAIANAWNLAPPLSWLGLA